MPQKVMRRPAMPVTKPAVQVVTSAKRVGAADDAAAAAHRAVRLAVLALFGQSVAAACEIAVREATKAAPVAPPAAPKPRMVETVIVGGGVLAGTWESPEGTPRVTLMKPEPLPPTSAPPLTYEEQVKLALARRNAAYDRIVGGSPWLGARGRFPLRQS